ncbi:hypothetical protein [Acanthopleuribacter pedis]|uniref:Uncharacterized protein n=1 Tax=Acanthopleuribacter pedis TaxID=442870 RepID=A0A8J7Q4E8_9BACT|nr:hypothetical protein [Acanthopleuribacter pedis]MBO1317551.1 hypothetical protein [Acanthopleuribacter pedis]
MARLIRAGVWLRDQEPPARKHRLYSPGATAALSAVQRLGEVPKHAVLIAVTASLGPMVAAFDKAWRAAAGGLLVGPGFADTRARRIHPFTLLKALDNQVPACLAAELGLNGPCRHFHDSNGLWPILAANINSVEPTGTAVLLVATDVRDADEAVTRRRYLAESRELPPQEGAVALLMKADPAADLPPLGKPDVSAFAAALDFARGLAPPSPNPC